MCLKTRHLAKPLAPLDNAAAPAAWRLSLYDTVVLSLERRDVAREAESKNSLSEREEIRTMETRG